MKGWKEMKRIVALLLCVTQLFGFVPHVHAEDATPAEAAECTHDWQQYDYAMGACSYKDNGDGTHTETITGSVKYYKCVLCTETKEETVDESGKYPHEYGSDGVCSKTGCGAVKPSEGCTEHTPYMDRENPHFGTSTGNYINKYLQDAHQHEYNCTFDQYCSTCGELLAENAGTGTSVKYEPHAWNNGKCTLCGYSCEHSYSDGKCTNCGAAEAQASCEHPADKLTEPDENNRFKKNEGVTNITDTQHTRTYEVWGYFTCECGVTGLERQITANGSTTEEHNFQNGVCVTTGCGATETEQEACEHTWDWGTCTLCGAECEHPSPVQVNTWYSLVSGEWTNNNNGTHTGNCVKVAWTRCDECSKYYEAPISGEEAAVRTIECWRWNGETGECSECGYQIADANDCTHESKTALENSESNFSYTDNNDGTHTVSYDVNTREECDECKMLFVEFLERITKSEGHTYADGVCACGATESGEDSCQHTNRHPDEENMTNKTLGEATAYTESESPSYYEVHKRAFTATANIVCEDCGAVLSTGNTINGSESEPHTWEDGVCTACGYVCAHNYTDGVCTYCDAEETADVCAHEWEGDSCTKCGEICGHDWSKKDGTCTICGTTCENGITTHAYENGVCTRCGYECTHYWNDNGVCSVCGVTCAHEETGTYPYTEKISDYVINGLYHEYQANVYDKVTCNQCHVTVETKLINENVTYSRKHDINPEDNTCYICGYELTCSHTNINELYWNWERGEATYVDEETHHNTYWYTLDKTCADCGLLLSCQPVDYDCEGDLPHTFVDGVCEYCGYSNACTHDGETYEEVLYLRDAKNLTFLNNQEHSYQVTKKVTVYCADCDEELSVTETADATVNEPHVLNADGECIYCLEAPCDHSDGGTYADYRMDFGTPVYKNEEFHVQPYTVTDIYKCNTCGELYDYKTREMEGDGGHDFDENGKCDCGAEGEYTGCAHENTEFRYCDENVTYSNIMESTHDKTADVYGYTWCLDCETRRTYQLDTPSKTTTEDHEYVKGEPVITTSYDVTAEGHAAITTTTTTYTCACGLSYDDVSSETAERVPHDFSEETCVCGEKCPHENRRPDEENMTDKILGAATQYTEEESPAYYEVHKRAFTAKANIVCEECGAVVSTGGTINGSESELHAWVDGECSDCGYVCKHEFKGGVCSNCEYECPHDSYTDGMCDVCDVACAHEKYTEGECDECGVICAHEKYTDGECDECGVICAHDSYTEGECDKCGAVCAHEKYTDGECDECGVICAHEKYTDGECDECGTVCAHEKYTDGVCDECGTVCAHDSYAEGVCSECGVICEHEAYSDGVCGECGILCEHESYTGGICNECGITCKHETYTSEICDECGEPCKHIDRFEEDPIDEYPVNAEWKDAGDGTHVITVREVFNWECLDCGRKDFTVINESKQISEGHDWSNGDSVCAVCGRKCAHEVLEIGNYDRIVSGFTPYDSEHCTWTVDVYEETWCEDCLVKIDEELVSAGEVRYEEHASDDGDYVCDLCGYQMPVPTPTPAPVVTPAPTRRPSTGTTVTVTATATPEPTAEPTVEPTPAPVVNEMVSTLVESAASAEEEGSVVTIDIVGAQEVFTEEEHEQLKALPVAEQILVTLSTIGFGDAVEAAMVSMDVTLSDEAAALVDQANTTMAQMTEEERKVMQETIEKNFPKTQVQINGVVYDYFILDLEIVVDGVARIESYGFRYDETLGQWIFVKMDTLDAQIVESEAV